MTVNEIISALEKVSFDLPTEALKAAEDQRTAITPELLKAVEQAATNPQPLLDDHQYQLHIYALYLLAKFREAKAYPHVVQFFNLPGEQPLDLAGDVLIEDGPLLLASICDGDINPIKTIAANEDAHPLIRNSALASIAVLYLWGERTREEVIAYYRSLFNGGLPQPGNTTVWAGLVTCCYHIQAQELANEVRNAYVNQLVINDALPYSEMEAGLMGGRRHMTERFVRRYRPIESTADAIAWWRCFKMGKKDKPAPKPATETENAESTPAKTENPYAKMNVGRNDPCPCGSGRKYKKCCGAPA